MEARLTIQEGFDEGTSFVLAAGDTKTIGQGPGADFVLEDPFLAAVHAALVFNPPASFIVVDMDPESVGTRVNHKVLAPRHPEEIRAGDVVWLGEIPLGVSVEGVELQPPPTRPAMTTAKRAKVVAEGRYEVERELGCGAMGRVFAGRRLSDDAPVAIKLLRGAVEEGSSEHTRFLREGALAAKIQSPYVVAVLEAVAEQERAYLVMERVEGRTLRDLVQERGHLEVDVALRCAEEIACGLSAAAEAGVVHRDLKPANVFLTPEGAVKLGDFGAAKSVAETQSALTMTGQGLGSMAYMAPEQIAEAKHVEPRADVYALGATLFHLLAGRPPFLPRTATDLVAVINDPPPSLAELRPELPAELVTLVEDMLSKLPEERPTASEARQRLAALREVS
ncbi:MAG TPA: hypothetical protein DEA08_31765 [Planctomycetes bacterium]|nr:hypothetical protein [Planctomycetota bacterium]